MIAFNCPTCGRAFQVPEEKAGKSGKCPGCQGQFTVPRKAAALAGGLGPLLPAGPRKDESTKIYIVVTIVSTLLGLLLMGGMVLYFFVGAGK